MSFSLSPTLSNSNQDVSDVITIIFNNICYFGRRICFVGLTKNVERFFFLHVFSHSNSHCRSLMKFEKPSKTKLGHLFVFFVGLVGPTVYSDGPLYGIMYGTVATLPIKCSCSCSCSYIVAVATATLHFFLTYRYYVTGFTFSDTCRYVYYFIPDMPGELIFVLCEI